MIRSAAIAEPGLFIGAPTPDRRRTASERRSARRFPFVAAVRQEMGMHEGRSFRLGQSIDIGLLGMQVHTRVRDDEPALPPASPILLSFELPDGLLRLPAQVAFDRRGGPGASLRSTGLRFVELSGGALLRLRLFLDRVLAMSPALVSQRAP